MTPRKRTAVIVGAVVAGYAAVVAAVYWRVFARDQMSGWDSAVEYWPDLVFQIRALGDGELPLWNPFALGGYPFWADPQTGMWSPLNWLLWLLSVPFGDGPWLIQAKILLLHVIGLCGMHAFVWRRTRSHAAAVVAALTFVLGSPLLVHKNSAIEWPLLWLPWALLAIDLFADRPSVRRGAALAAAMWLVGTAGSPPSFFYTLLILVPYGLFKVALALGLSWRADRAQPWRRLAGTLPGVLTLVVIAGLLLAITWLPAGEAVAESPRAQRGLGYVLSGSMETSALHELFVPYLDNNWMVDIYVGAIPLAAAAWLLIAAGKPRERAETALWIVIGVLGIDLALGKHGHLLPWLGEHAPGFGLFRIAYRYKLVFGTAAAVLAGDATARLVRGELTMRSRVAWGVVAAVWLALAAREALVWPASVLSAAILGALAVAAFVPRPRVRLAVAVIVPALVFSELWHAGKDKLAILQKTPDVAKMDRQIAQLAETRAEWRYHVGNPSMPYGGAVAYQVAHRGSLREQSGYPMPAQRARHADLEKRAKKDPALLLHFNVRFFAGHKTPPPGGQGIGGGILDVPGAAPAVRWFAGARVLKSSSILDAFAMIPPDATTVAYVEAADVRGLTLPTVEGPAVAGRVRRFERNRIVVEIDAPADGIVVLAEGWSPGWTATVDGVATRVFRANYHQRAVQVGPGPHVIVWQYDPPGVVPLLLAFFVGLAALALIALGRWRWLDQVGGGRGATPQV